MDAAGISKVTATNHALTGALIGMTIVNPVIAIPLAIISHFVLDAIPHYDASGTDVERIGSRRLVYEQLLLGGVLCFLIVLALFLTRPQHWLTAAICAFLATSPDLLWIPRFLHVRRTGRDMKLNSFLRFHNWIQWWTAPKLMWVELAWFLGMGALFITKLA